MKHQFLITIDGEHIVDGNLQSISLSTLGTYERRDGKDYISYEEPGETELDRGLTTVVLDRDKCATITQLGQSNSNLVIERGQKHMCHYETDFGRLSIGVRADKIENHLKVHGGRVRLRYSLDFNSNAMSVNELNITVKEAGTHV